MLVIGAAGVGKSRLRQELVEWVQRQPDRAEVLFGGGDSLGGRRRRSRCSARAIRRAAGHPSTASRSRRGARSSATRVARHVDREARARVAAFLGEIADVPFPDEDSEALRAARANPQLMGDAMRRAWEDWLAAECAAHPVLLVLEDLHWGDLGTVSFIDARCATCATRRSWCWRWRAPRWRSGSPTSGGARTGRRSGSGRCRRGRASSWCAQALASDRRRSSRASSTRADGNAFYLEELIRATAAGRADALPDSVLAMVQARLDAEGPDGKRVLRAAAVFGERFSRAGVAALLGRRGAGSSDVSDALERLAARELVARAPTAGAARRRRAAVRPRAGARGGLRDAHRRGSGARPPAGGRLARAGRGRATRWCWPSTSAAAASRRAPARWYERAAAQALRANDLGAAIERAELGIASGAAGEPAGKLRLIRPRRTSGAASSPRPSGGR